MTATTKKARETYTVEPIQTDFVNSVFLGDPSIDKLLGCVVGLGTELWATQRRLKVIEAVMASKGITTAMIEQYVPSAEESAAWEKDRDRFVSLAFSALGDDGFRPASADLPQA